MINVQEAEKNIKKNLANDTGVFLESKISECLKKIKNSVIKREEQYWNPYDTDTEGTIDILAILNIKNKLFLFLPIECKRATNKQKYWVFEKNKENNIPLPFEFLGNERNGGRTFNHKKEILFPNLGYENIKKFERAIQCFEFNQDTGKINNDSSNKPFLSMKQANSALIYYAYYYGNFLNPEQSKKYLLFLPIVVTTADLYLLGYKKGDINLIDGKIPDDKIILKNKKWIEYDFPLSAKLQNRSCLPINNKRPTFIVNSNNFSTFIEKLIDDCKKIKLS